MKQIEKIRRMSAEELAKWLLDEVEQQQFSTDVCVSGHCPRVRAFKDAEKKGEDIGGCTEEDCLVGAVAYLESEVPE